ncbi:MAG: hypothetical protein ABSC21_02010 [Terriglobia bacterium]
MLDPLPRPVGSGRTHLVTQRGTAATKDQVFIADWRLVIGDWGLTRRGGLIAD